MQENKDAVEVVTTPAVAPVIEAPELDEKPVETEDSFVEDSLGTVLETKTEAPSEEVTPEPEAQTVAPEEKKEEAPAEPVEEKKEESPESQPEAPKVEPEAKVSRLDRRLAEKYAENLVLKGVEVPSWQQIGGELSTMSLEEKKIALRNLLDENRSIRGQQPAPLSVEDEEAIIEAEVDRRYQEEQRKDDERVFKEDLASTLKAHPELDKRTDKYNQKLEKAIIPMIKSGMLTSEAYSIVQEAIKNAKEEERKTSELDNQRAMSGAVTTQPVSEVINKEPETDEEKFLADALG